MTYLRRPRGEEASDVEVMNGQQKRVKRTSVNGDLGEAASTGAGHLEPSTRTNVIPQTEATGRGAGSPASLNAHESTEVTAQEKLPGGGTGADAGSLEIPECLSERHRRFLAATPDGRECGTVKRKFPVPPSVRGVISRGTATL